MQQSVSQHNFCMLRHKNFSKPKKICHTQELNVATNFRQSSMAKEKFYIATNFFSVTTLVKKGVRKTVGTIRCSITTKIKTESKEAVLRQYNLCRNIKS